MTTRDDATRDEQLVKVITDAQDILATYIVPDSGISDHECINRLLGLLDGSQVRAALSVPSERGDRCPKCGISSKDYFDCGGRPDCPSARSAIAPATPPEPPILWGRNDAEVSCWKAGWTAGRAARETIDMAEIKDQCEQGLTFSPEHQCPATFALAAIWAEIKDAA